MTRTVSPDRQAAMSGPSVLVMARLPQERADAPLADVLGFECWVQLQRLLLSRALDWARAVGPVFLALAGWSDRADRSDFRQVDVFAQEDTDPGTRLSRAIDHVAAGSGGPGPLLIAWPSLPRWRAAHAEAAVGDLEAGTDISVGPVFDGGFYLIALARPLPALFELPGPSWDSPDAMRLALAVVQQAGIEAGILQAERGLRTRADVQAAVVDPLLDRELRGLLEVAQ